MEFDWKSVVKAVAPVLGATFGGPLGAAGMKAISEAVLGKPDGTPEEIDKAVEAGMTPEQLVALRNADNNFKVRMAELGLDTAKLNAQIEQAYLSDTQDARQAHKGDAGVFKLGIAVILTFAVILIASLYGSYQLLTGGITLKDASIIAAVSGFVGTIVGYASSNAQQVLGYFFGSSKGSADKTTALSDSIKTLGRR